MYFLFSLTTLSFWSTGCEQRPELGKSVEFVSQTTKETPIEKLEKAVEDGDIQKDKSVEMVQKKEKTNSEQDGETLITDNEVPPQKEDLFDEETFQLDSSEMGQDVAKVLGVETNAVTTSNVKNIQVSSVEFVGEWPVQLIGILGENFPKRAVLRRANGSELVVQAGQVLGEEKLVVLAIGKNHVSLAKVHPDGNVATIQQIDLQPLD